MEIRHMLISDDRMAISRVYEESWKFAYKGLIPQSYLDSIPAGRWVPMLESPGTRSLLLLDGDEIVGSSCYCKSRYEAFSDFGEIVSLYLLPEYIGRGYGRLLLDSVLAELAGMGFREVFLWVLEGNERAIRCYERAGFAPSGDYLDDNIGGAALKELQYRRTI